MKYLFCSILFVFILNTGYAQKGLTIEEDLVEVAFDSTIDKDDLILIQSKLSEKEIDIIYEKMTFNDNGKLFSISFEVNCNDGFKGAASQMFLTETIRVGFIRDYKKDVKKPFQVGTL